MRHVPFPVTLLLVLFFTLSTAWSFPSFPLRKRIPPYLVNNNARLRHERSLQGLERFKQWLSNQEPLKGAAIPNAAEGTMPPPQSQSSGNEPIISDVLPKTRGINVFASLTRQFESVEGWLNDPSKNVTVLAPRNSAIQNLPRKPWENPDDYKKYGEVNAYEGDGGHDRASRNLKRFVSAHIVARSPWKEGEEVETIGGDKLRWRKEGDKIYIEPSGIEVESIAEQVSNGEVWVLNGVINYSQ